MALSSKTDSRLDAWYPTLLPLSIMANALVLILLLAAPARADYGEGDPRLERLYASYISPSCWRQNLTAHNSPDANRLRSRIAGMVKNGQTDDQIKLTLVTEYGKRIMSLPEGGTRVWLFWTPATLLFAGCASLLWLLRRMKHSPGQPAFMARRPNFRPAGTINSPAAIGRISSMEFLVER